MTREEAIRQIENRWDIIDYGESEALGEAIDMAIEALSEDAVDVVRCKDCRYYEESGLPCPLDLCTSLGEDGFCSVGKEREDDV